MDYEYKKILADLNKGLKEIEIVRQDPEKFIYEYFAEITRQVDLRRETLIEEIHQYSSGLIQKIAHLKEDYMAKSKKFTSDTKNLDEVRCKISNLNVSLESDGIKQERSKEINELMQPLLAQYKLESEGKKLYKLETSEVKLEALFGSLTTLDSEIKKVKVSISRLRILD